MKAPNDPSEIVGYVRGLPAGERLARNIALLDAVPLIDLELASICNVSCSFCPRQQVVRSDMLMSEATFLAFQSFLPLGAVIMISGMGDSLLHPRAVEMVRSLVDRGHSVCLVTNGLRLTPDCQQHLIGAGISQFQVSLHGLDADSAALKITEPYNLQLVLANLEYLSRNRPNHLRVRVNFVETPGNAVAARTVEAYASNQGFEYYHRRLHCRGGALGEGRPAARDEGCGIYSSVTFISSDGNILPCVNDVSGNGLLGNVRTVAWSDVKAWKFRTINEGKWFPSCQHCDDDYRWVLIGMRSLDQA